MITTRSVNAIVLAGGSSERMGYPKALLDFDGLRLIDRVINVLDQIFHKVIVVGGSPEIMSDRIVVSDDNSLSGPLVGLQKGILVSDASWNFVAGCDMPFLNPGVIKRMSDRIQDSEVVLARIRGHLQPLHAFYSRECLPNIHTLLDEGVTSLRALISLCDISILDSRDFIDIDPELRSFQDIDTPSEYREALNLTKRVYNGTAC